MMNAPFRVAYLMVCMGMFVSVGALKLVRPAREVGEPFNIIFLLGNDHLWGSISIILGIFAAMAIVFVDRKLIIVAYGLMAAYAGLRGIGYIAFDFLVQLGDASGVMLGIIWMHIALGLLVACWSGAGGYPRARLRKGEGTHLPTSPVVPHASSLREQIANGEHRVSDDGGGDGRN